MKTACSLYFLDHYRIMFNLLTYKRNSLIADMLLTSPSVKSLYQNDSIQIFPVLIRQK